MHTRFLVIRRTLLFLLCLIVGFVAVAWLSDCNRILKLPFGDEELPAGLDHSSPLLGEYQDPFNGLYFCIGLLFLFLAVLGMSRVFRKAHGTFIDRWLSETGDVWAGLTGPLFLLISVGFLYVGWRHIDFHIDADKAAQAYASEGMGEVNNAGHWMFAVDDDGVTHLAAVRPALFRALGRHGVQLPPDRERRMAVPGFSPILLLLAITCWGVYRRLKDGRLDDRAISRRQTRGAVLAFIASLYVLFWLTAGNQGNEQQIFNYPAEYLEAQAAIGSTADESLSEWDKANRLLGVVTADIALKVRYMRLVEWWMSMKLLLIGNVASLAVVIFKLDDVQLGDQTRAGWSFIFFLLQLLLFAGVGLVCNTLLSLPLILWGLAYLTALGAAWTATQPFTFWGMES